MRSRRVCFDTLYPPVFCYDDWGVEEEFERVLMCLVDRKGKEGQGGRYAVFDVQYEAGEGLRNKISMSSVPSM